MPLDMRWMSSSAFRVAKNTRRYTKPRTILWRVTAAEVMRCDRIISRKSWAFLRRNTWIGLDWIRLDSIRSVRVNSVFRHLKHGVVDVRFSRRI